MQVGLCGSLRLAASHKPFDSAHFGFSRRSLVLALCCDASQGGPRYAGRPTISWADMSHARSGRKDIHDAL